MATGNSEAADKVVNPNGDGYAANVVDVAAQPALPTQTEDVSTHDVQHVDPGCFHVVQSRANNTPSPERIESIIRAIKEDRQMYIQEVYQNEPGTIRWAPSGKALQAAYRKANELMPVRFITVEDPQRAAEMASCRANEENGEGRSAKDKQYQAGKAIPFLEESLGRPPKPKELAEFTLTSQKFCRDFLRSHYSKKDKADDDGSEIPSEIPASLVGMVKSLQKIKIPGGWMSGDETNNALRALEKELQRLKKHGRQEHEVTGEDLAKFMEERNYSRQKMAALLDVVPVTISRWQRGAEKMSATNMRRLYQVMHMDEATIAALLDEGDGDGR